MNKKGTIPVGHCGLPVEDCAIRTDQLAERHLYVSQKNLRLYRQPKTVLTQGGILCIAHCLETTFHFN